MSEVAGRMAIQEGAKFLERPMSGRGVLLAGVPGVEPADVLILGGGIVGANAARIAAGMGARVTVLDVNLDRMRYLDDVLPPNVRTLMSDSHSVRACIRTADLRHRRRAHRRGAHARARPPQALENHEAARGDGGRGD